MPRRHKMDHRLDHTRGHFPIRLAASHPARGTYRSSDARRHNGNQGLQASDSHRTERQNPDSHKPGHQNFDSHTGWNHSARPRQDGPHKLVAQLPLPPLQPAPVAARIGSDADSNDRLAPRPSIRRQPPPTQNPIQATCVITSPLPPQSTSLWFLPASRVVATQLLGHRVHYITTSNAVPRTSNAAPRS